MTGPRAKRPTVYADPTVEEMLGLCLDFGIVGESHAVPGGFIVRVLGERMQLARPLAEVFLRGLLLGYFFNHSSDDLSLAEWYA